MRLLLLILFLLVPCQACLDDGGQTVCFNCGTYDLTGNYLTDLKITQWEEGPDGERINEEIYDGPGRLNVDGFGCAQSLNGIPGLADDDTLVVDSDVSRCYDEQCNYSALYHYRGTCNLDSCYLDATLDVVLASGRTRIVAEIEWKNFNRLR